MRSVFFSAKYSLLRKPSQFKIGLRGLSLIASMGLLAGCSSFSEKNTSSPNTRLPEANSRLFTTASQHVPTEAELMTLSSVQLAELKRFVQQPERIDLAPRLQVAEFIEANIVSFNYEGKNYPATVALEKGSGNCMTLAMLTYAVAKALNVQIKFQVIHSAPMLLDIKNNLAISSDHVRSFLFDKSSNGLYLSGASTTVIDYFPERLDRTGAVVSEQRFLAMYYRNLAADALIKNDFNLSYALLQKGLALDSSYSPLINMMAIVHRRLGDYATAAQFYQYGSAIEQSSLVLLSNYRQLLLAQGNLAAAKDVENTLLTMDDPTPYEWYIMGQDALTQNNYVNAKVYLTRFLKGTPYFHQGYYDLARAQFGLGEVKQAQDSLKKAIALAELPENERKYQAKLHWLNDH